MLLNHGLGYNNLATCQISRAPLGGTMKKCGVVVSAAALLLLVMMKKKMRRRRMMPALPLLTTLPSGRQDPD